MRFRKVMTMDKRPILGQEVICPDGLGRVMSFEENHGRVTWVQVSTYINDRESKWDAGNVELIDPCGPVLEKLELATPWGPMQCEPTKMGAGDVARQRFEYYLEAIDALQGLGEDILERVDIEMLTACFSVLKQRTVAEMASQLDGVE